MLLTIAFSSGNKTVRHIYEKDWIGEKEIPHP